MEHSAPSQLDGSGWVVTVVPQHKPPAAAPIAHSSAWGRGKGGQKKLPARRVEEKAPRVFLSTPGGPMFAWLINATVTLIDAILTRINAF